MKRLKIGLLVAVTIAACQGKPAPGRESAAMQDMKGMPHARASPESSGVPINRTEAQRLGITFARASEATGAVLVSCAGRPQLRRAESRLRQCAGGRVGRASICGLRRQTRRTRRTAARPVLPDLLSAQESTSWLGG